MDFASAVRRTAQGESGLAAVSTGFRLLLLDGSGAGGVVELRGDSFPCCIPGPWRGALSRSAPVFLRSSP